MIVTIQQEIELLASTEELKYFGLGVYFYFEFMRRVAWLFLIMSIIVIFTIVINWHGSGMSSYASSFSTYLIKSTVGTSYLIQAIIQKTKSHP